MKELYVFCEGPTEQGFCVQVLTPHLFPHHDGYIHTIRIAHSKHHGVVSRGGIGKYASLKRDIQNTLKSRRENNVFFTSMIDLYALPTEFPGKAGHVRDPNNPTPYVEALEAAFGGEIGDFRFTPHLQLHEYETVLLADPESFRISFDHCDKEIAALKTLVASVVSIEHINDGKDTAPSKRIIDLIPAYDALKTSAGPDIAEYTGIVVMRAKCPHFDKWLSKLEGLNWGGA